LILSCQPVLAGPIHSFYWISHQN